MTYTMIDGYFRPMRRDGTHGPERFELMRDPFGLWLLVPVDVPQDMPTLTRQVID